MPIVTNMTNELLDDCSGRCPATPLNPFDQAFDELGRLVVFTSSPASRPFEPEADQDKARLLNAIDAVAGLEFVHTLNIWDDVERVVVFTSMPIHPN